ncbi:YhcN/YlaJ family sporulation lipoprotein [Peribacillus tepidiphilus]|jgi:YhcN/YlaJ family sporulation lipoprotein|uniref:YhcN/YlaJ family sporulation lipoprotein n=1 Tax=Peribacillus tepidiphilus TaxID=2652445 RepID=UPI001291598B|nr:YhcN/YlaJ family sporulation lipoprotein [Peribacillus tepidiphilus]
MKHRLVIFITFMILGGCQMHKDQVAEQKNQAEQKIMNVKNSVIEDVDRKTGEKVAKRLVQLAVRLPHVHDATAIVLGPYALVGIDIDGDVERSQVGSIKYSVAESLKHDPYGARSIIVADPDIKARIDEISEDIQAGKPIEGIMNELADIAGRLMPEIPGEILQPIPSKATEQPKEELNPKESRELNKEQQEQSNHHKK